MRLHAEEMVTAEADLDFCHRAWSAHLVTCLQIAGIPLPSRLGACRRPPLRLRPLSVRRGSSCAPTTIPRD